MTRPAHTPRERLCLIVASLGLLWLPVAGCGDDNMPPDAGADAGADAGPDTGVDSGTDGGADGGLDAATDAGTDAPTDAYMHPDHDPIPANRAYRGAPPTMPPEVHPYPALECADCMTCHGDPPAGTAPSTPHPERIVCQSCHLRLQDVPPRVPSTFMP